MTIWMVRGGRYGHREDYALENNLAVVGWDDMGDLSGFSSREELKDGVAATYSDAKPGTISSWAGQLWRFSTEMKAGDTISMPLKNRGIIAFGQITGEYHFDPDAPSHSRHQRRVKWKWPNIAREDIDQDILFSYGSSLTICQIWRNEAERRIHALLKGEKPRLNTVPSPAELDDGTEIVSPIDLEIHSDDLIRKHLSQKFVGHKLAALVDEILKAQGFHTFVSDPGPDGGVDILAGKGVMGFDSPRICVQVKSAKSEQDISTLRELRGVVEDHKAEYGLFVAWGGFKKSIQREKTKHFFNIRLWTANEIIEYVKKHYSEFSEEIKAELPLKRIWTFVTEEEE